MTTKAPTTAKGRIDDGWQRIAHALAALPAARLRPQDVARTTSLPRAELDTLTLTHRQRPLRRELLALRLARAVTQLTDAGQGADQAARTCGFSSHGALDRALLDTHGVDAESLRSLPGQPAFDVVLPRHYRRAEALAYIARDPASVNVRRTTDDGVTFAVVLDDTPTAVSITLGGRDDRARVTLAPRGRHGASLPLQALVAVNRVLGLSAESRALVARARHDPAIARLIRGRPGLTVQLTAGPWDAIVWAVLGQQISLHAAYGLLRALCRAAGEPCGDGLYTLPQAKRIAAMSLDELGACKLSRAKSRFLHGLATGILDGRIDLQALACGSAPYAYESLVAERGIGPWTANYVMMRGLGFADCAPLGDAGLRRALKRFHGLDAAPDDEQMRRLMAGFAPHRSLATFHLWRGFDSALPTG